MLKTECDVVRKIKKYFVNNGLKYVFWKELSGNIERQTCTKRKFKFWSI